MAYLETDSPVNVGNSGYGNGFMNGDGFWAIILLAIIFGWGGNGYGFGGGRGASNGGAVDGYVLASDFSNIERKIDSVNNGICDGFYAMNTGMLNGFAGVTNAITTGGYETRNAINGLSSQLAQCCCENRAAIADVKYNMAMNTCNINETVNANFRALHDEIVANRIEDKNAQIAAQQNEINALRLKASQEAQNTYLINQLKPSASPAYIVANPNCCYNACGNGTCGSSIL